MIEDMVYITEIINVLNDRERSILRRWTQGETWAQIARSEGVRNHRICPTTPH